MVRLGHQPDGGLSSTQIVHLCDDIGAARAFQRVKADFSDPNRDDERGGAAG
jgi:hypothetical protein